MISMSPDELNLLIFRHLQEAGFSHSAYALENEAGISRSTRDVNMVPPGALVTFVQKGIQYLEQQANVNYNDADTDDGFSFLQPLDLITKDADELQKIVKEKKESVQKTRHREKEKEPELMDVEAVDISLNSTATICIIPDSDVTVLNGHASEDIKSVKVGFLRILNRVYGVLVNSSAVVVASTVRYQAFKVFACAWSPSGPLLASGAGESTARIWTINEGVLPKSVELKHSNGGTPSRDVTALDWNSEGTLLATCSYDGQARIWSRDGELVNTLTGHKGPIFTLKWNKKGDYLLSASADKAAIVWNTKTGEWKQQFKFSAPMLDADWRNNASFATCSTDKMIYVCKVGDDRPIKTFSGHQGEVNAVKWDPTGQLLASCSDDSTAKIWSMEQNTCLHDLKEHTAEIYTIKWSPTGPGTNIPNRQLLLASASFDSTIKLWDVKSGSLIYSLNGHREPVYAVAFSPNGDYIASGSLDRCVNVWSVKDARIVKTYTGNGGIYEVCWNKEGDKIAACFASNEVCVMDFRM